MKKNKVHLIFSIAIIIVYAASIKLTLSYLGRPIGGYWDYVTAHTLISLEFFKTCGFWKHAGISTVFPVTELMNCSTFWEPANLQNKSIYTTYPSLWIALPYAVFSFVELFKDIAIDETFIQIFNLVFVRLGIAIVIAYIGSSMGKEFKKLLFPSTPKNHLHWFIPMFSFAIVFFWLINPYTLYFTQHVYFADVIIILPAYILIYVICFQKQDSLHYKLITGAVSFWLIGTDWYGWFFLMFLIPIHIMLTYNISFLQMIKGIKEKFAQYIKTILPILLGAIFASTIYLLQFYIIDPEFTDLIKSFLKWFHGSPEAKDSIQSIFFQLSFHWQTALPSLYFKLFYPTPEFDLSNTNRISMAIILLGIFSIIYLAITKKNKKLYYSYLLMLLPTIAYFTLLPIHASVHPFSSLKLVLPLVIAFIITPFLALQNLLYKTKLIHKKLTKVIAIILAIAFFGGHIALIKKPMHLLFMPYLTEGKELNDFLKKNTYPHEIPVYVTKFSIKKSLTQALSISSFSPTRLWYTKRFIYSIQDIEESSAIWQSSSINYKAVLITFTKNINDQTLTIKCPAQWINTNTKFRGQSISLCRTKALSWDHVFKSARFAKSKNIQEPHTQKN